MALEDDIRTVLADAADRGRPDMTKAELDSLAIDLARKLRPLLIGEPTVETRGGRRVHLQTSRPTDRQMQTLVLLADGLDLVGVAEALGLTRQSIHDHIRRLARRFDVPVDVCQVVNAGFALGWLPVPEKRADLDLDLRDLTTLGLIASGRQAEIGAVTGLSPYRVRSQRARLMRDLGALSDAGLVAAGWRAGLLPVAPRAEVTGASSP